MEISKPYAKEENVTLWYQGLENLLQDVKRDISRLINDNDNHNDTRSLKHEQDRTTIRQ